ncbi:MAG: 2-isopropylmalate synthase [Kouleothrix sp.]|nr:2-isopropylmalate synthase [Kouleothrix sp.]
MESHVPDHVRIFDTTLRDGEQAPGCTMTKDEKLDVARQLARLGVDIMEAGFPAASPGDWEAVNAIASEIGTPDGPVICGLARANKDDIDKCWTAIEPAARKRIHTFMSTSDIHLEHQFRKSRGEALELIGEMVSYACSLCDDVEFSPMDAGRSDPQFLYQVLKVAVECGATTLNIPDTVGYTTPEEYYNMIDGIRRNVPGADKVILSTHCHDDLGLAVANSLAGVRAGARQIECTVNGIGERAGNASLEEVVMALHTRKLFFGIETRINTRELARASRLVSACTGVHVPPNKAIVGANAFAHESGIHQDGVLKHRQTYEIMSAETVGLDGNTMVLGKHSGRHAFRKHLESIGVSLSDDDFRHVFARFKELADKKKVVDDRDIEALIAGEAQRPVPIYELDYVQVFSGTDVIPTATVRMRGPGGEARTESAQGTGPIDAACQAINRIVGQPGELVEFAVGAITEGINAVAEVTMRVQEYGSRAAESESNGKTFGADRSRQPRVFSGYGVNTDTVIAAAEAYTAALNKLFHARQERQKAGSRQEGSIEAVDLFGNSMLGKAD